MYCDNCGKENKENNSFCAYCGEKIKENANEKLNNLQVCPVCNAETNGEKFCHKCGAQLENLFCTNCGKKLAPNSQFCNECGHSVLNRGTSNNTNNSSIALAGFICSIVGMFILPVVLGIIALILGIIGRNQDNISEKSRKQATTAIVLGIIDIILTFVYVGFIVGLYSTLFFY